MAALRRWLAVAAPWLPLALVVLLLVGGVVGWRQYTARLRAEGRLEAETQAHLVELAAANARAVKADTVYRMAVDTLHRRLTTYDSLRVRVPVFDTARTVVVDTQFVVAADSVRRACRELENSCAARHAADSARYEALARLAADYKTAAGLGAARRVRVRPAVFGGYGYGWGDTKARPLIGAGLSVTWGR